MWSRREAFASSLSPDLWPTVSKSALHPDDVEKYEANELAMRLYFECLPVRFIAERTGVAATSLPRMARKCLEVASDGKIFGFRALIPNIRTTAYKRSAPLGKKFGEQQGGQAGALGMMLERFPEIEEKLIRVIRQDAKHKEVSEFRLRSRDLHKLFIKVIQEYGVTSAEWPFTTKHRGINSIRSFMRDVLDRNFKRSVNNREGSAAKAHINVGTGHAPFLRFTEPYDVVEIDAHKIECHLTVTFRTPEGTETDLLLDRLWLIAAVETASGAILSYLVVYRSEVTKDDVIKVVRDAVAKKWEPLELTVPGLTYPPNAGLPSGVIERAFGALWSVTMLDGALAHLATTVHTSLRKGLGFVINWGPVAHFERRDSIERTFGQIASKLFKRLPSTTGSSPNNGRAPNAQNNALKYKIRAADVAEVLDVTIAQHNAEPNSGISSLSPLQYLKYHLEGDSPLSTIRRLPKDMSRNGRTFSTTIIVTVRGGRDTGRRPYIQLDGAHYTNPILAEAGYLVGKQLFVDIDDSSDDYRQVRAYLENGADFGYLSVQGKWAYTKHSRRTRKTINSLVNNKTIVVSEFDDPVHAYLAYLTKISKVKGRTQSPSVKQVTKATHVSRESGLELILDSASKPEEPKIRTTKDVTSRSSLLDSPIEGLTKVRNRR